MKNKHIGSDFDDFLVEDGITTREKLKSFDKLMRERLTSEEIKNIEEEVEKEFKELFNKE